VSRRLDSPTAVVQAEQPNEAALALLDDCLNSPEEEQPWTDEQLVGRMEAVYAVLPRPFEILTSMELVELMENMWVGLGGVIEGPEGLQRGGA
jgi:hypothetical protein